MDTPLELARDAWFMKHQGECVTCKYYMESKKVAWCGCPESEYEGADVSDIPECDLWEEV